MKLSFEITEERWYQDIQNNEAVQLKIQIKKLQEQWHGAL